MSQSLRSTLAAILFFAGFIALAAWMIHPLPHEKTATWTARLVSSAAAATSAGFLIWGRTLKNKARYINHSCDPNCDVERTHDTLWIVALRDIKEGEELSYNYGYTLKHYKDNPCNCGAKNCCGYILDQQYWGFIQSKAIS